MFEVVAHFHERHTLYSFDPFIVIVGVYLGLYSCQVRVFSGSKSGRIPDQGGEDGRADVGLGRN